MPGPEFENQENSSDWKVQGYLNVPPGYGLLQTVNKTKEIIRLVSYATMAVLRTFGLDRRICGSSRFLAVIRDDRDKNLREN